MIRLPLLGLLLLLFASPASAQPKTIHSALSMKKTGAMERIPVPRPSNEKPDTTRYQPITTVKSDFVVNSGNETYGSNQENIDIVNGPDGAFLCTWTDHRTWAPYINAQLFDHDDIPIGPMIRVSDLSVDDWITTPRLVFNARSNEYVVVWQSNYEILMQRFSVTGDKIGGNTFLGYTSDPFRLSAAADSSGNIYITWTDYGAALSPYCQIVSKDGVPLTGQLSLVAADTAYISGVRDDRSIAVDGSGRCLVVWNRDIGIPSKSQIVLQSVSGRGTLYKHPLVVNEADAVNNHLYPTIASTKDGHFFILWRNESTMFGRIFHPDSGFVTPQMPLTALGELFDPYVVSSNGEDKFFVVWKHDKVFGQVFSSRGEPIGAPVILSVPSVSALSKGLADRLYLGYGISERSESVVMVQPFDLSFNPIGRAQRVTNAPNSAAQLHPVVRYNRCGQALAVWTDRRNGYDDLYGQLLDAAGNPMSANFQINDTTSHANNFPSIATDPDGNFTVAFAAGDYTTKNVKLQKIFSNGMPGGGNIDAGSAFRTNYDNLSCYIQADSVRNALVCWWSGKNAPLYSRRFDAALTPSGDVKPIFNAGASSPMNILSVSANHRFDILVLWTDFMGDYFTCQIPTGGTLKAIVIDEKGKIIRDTLLVGVVPDNKQFDHATCRLDDEGNMLFVWTDRLVGPGDVTLHTRRVYPNEGVIRTDSSLSYYTYDGAQIAKFEKKQSLIAWDTYPRMRALFIDDASLQTGPIDLKTAPMADYYQSTNYHSFSADCYDYLLFTAFQKVDGERSFDIFANIQFFGRIGGVSAEASENVVSVYPNPVGQSASIRYAFESPTDVRIAVYNILGQKIADIEQGMKPPGQYTVQFPTQNLSTGVYFFVLNGIKTSATKFIVVK